jgi:hypothetical protein
MVVALVLSLIVHGMAGQVERGMDVYADNAWLAAPVPQAGVERRALGIAGRRAPPPAAALWVEASGG